MTALGVYLFGGFRLQRDEELLPAIPSREARSLLAYLITYRDRPHTRDILAGLFWPDLPDARARRRLTQALWHIRHTLKAFSCPQSYILTEADTVQFNVDAPYWLDVEEFQIAYQHEALRDAVELYRGDFLAGYYDDWAVIERERLRDMYLIALDSLVRLCKTQGAFEEALAFAHQITLQDPLHEKAHREVMRLCHHLGRLNEALQQYEVCRTVLAEELGTESTPATTALYREILARAREARVPYLPPAVRPPPSPLLEETGRVPLVGRQGERAALVDYVEQALRGCGGLALVEGEAGVGKTRLLQEVAQDAGWREVQVLWGRGRELGELLPYGVLREALESALSPLRAGQLAQLVDGIWLRETSLILPQLAEWLPDLPPRPSLEPAQERERLLEALTRTILALGQIAPHVLILDDLQWADETTLEVLIRLTPRLAQSRVLIIGSYRSQEARERAAVWDALRTLDQVGGPERLLLARLGDTETGELVQQALGLVRSAPRFAERLFHETVGNPLFVLETLRALHDQKLLYRDEAGEWSTPWDETTADYAEMPVPPELHRLIAGRLARLGPAVRSTLNTAAVMGAEFDLALLLRASTQEQTTVLAAVDELLRRGVLIEKESTYQFSHDKVRQTAYTAMTEGERQRLHWHAGEALEALRPDLIADLAHHFFLGQEWRQAARYNHQAGDQAAGVYANREAVTYYTHALEALEFTTDPARRAALLMAREAVNNRLGEREAQAADLMALHAELGEPGERSALALRWASYHDSMSDYPAMLEAAQTAAALAKQVGDQTAEAAGGIEWGRALWLQGDYTTARSILNDALVIARAAGDQQQVARGLYNLGIVSYEQNRHRAAQNYHQQAITIFRDVGDRHNEAGCLNSLGNLYNDLGDRDTAREQYQAGLRIRRATGDRRGEAILLYNLSVLHHDAGDDETALQYCRQMTDTARSITDQRLEAYGLTYLGLLLEESEPATASRHYARALDIRREIGQPALAVDSLAGLARTALHGGQMPEALRHIDEALAWIAENGSDGVGDVMLVYLTAYRVYTAAGDTERAATVLEVSYSLMMEQAAGLPDDAAREAFLENIPVRRELLAAYRALQIRRHGRQISLHLPHAEAPTGRPLRDDERVEVTWTVAAPEDDAICGKVARRQHRLRRLLREAGDQRTAPTVDDLADALEVSRATIKRDLAALREAGHQARTRGSRGAVSGLPSAKRISG